MGPIIPIAGAIQWVSGIAVALIALQRGRRYERAGRVPRALARLALAIFLVAGVELASALTPVRSLAQAWISPDFANERWQLRALLAMCVTGWSLIAAAGIWNGALGVNHRRRMAASELRRRTERALATSGRKDASSIGRSPP